MYATQPSLGADGSLVGVAAAQLPGVQRKFVGDHCGARQPVPHRPRGLIRP